MGAGHSAEGEGGACASDPPAHDRRKSLNKRRRHSVDSVASYSSQNHVDRIRTQNYSAASCHDEGDFGSIKTSLFRRSSSNLEFPHKRPESVTSNTSSTRSRLREFVERKSSQDEHKSAVNTVGDIQYFENPTETLEFDRPRNSLESKKSQEDRPKKRKLTKNKDKDKDKEHNESKNKKHEKYQSKLAEYYKVPVQLPQDEFYQHLTRSKAAEDLLKKGFSNSDTEFSGSYGRLCKHKEPEGSNLRRSRSLAVIREETYNDLQIQNTVKTKRSQLIPRARLFDKPCFKDRLPGRAKYQTKEEVLESIYIDSTASCFADINAQKINEIQEDKLDNRSEKEDNISRHESHHSQSVSGSWPNLNDETKQTHVSEDSIGHSRNPSEIDSLDSNYVRKHYNFEAHLKGYKDSSPETERSVISPNNSKQLYITTDDHDSDNEDRERSKNNTPKSFTNDSLSITHSEKDKADLNDLSKDIICDIDTYDEISLKSRQSDIKESSLQPEVAVKTPELKREEDSNSVISENDTISSPPDSITSYISISIASSTDKSHKLEHLANSLAEKIDEYCESQTKETVSNVSQTAQSEIHNSENDPLYTKVNKKKTFADIRRDSFQRKASNCNIFNEVEKKHSNEVYVSNTYIESENYLMTNNCTSSKNITTEPFVTTLIENQYYSLPDINISKCLRKSERIDAQLRKEDPEDIPCENTYEIAHSHFREILSTKGNENYGQLNKINTNNQRNPEFEPQIIQSFTKLEDDLKSIITIESSNNEDQDLNFFRSDTHQNEREINEIEGTIRNNKVITKSEILKINSNSDYRPNNISKSYSHDNINNNIQEKKSRTAIRKHYSLRQRDPTEVDLYRLPSPGAVQKSVHHPANISTGQCSLVNDAKPQSLLSRVQSFKTSAETDIAIVPLSGHQTIVLNPPITRTKEESTTLLNNPLKSLTSQNQQDLEILPQKNHNLANNLTKSKERGETASNSKKEIKEKVIKPNSSVDTSSYCTPKDPFITIKLNKVVKTIVPKLKKESIDKIESVQQKFEKPPPRLIIKENKKIETPNTKPASNMTRPQVLQVIDSRNNTKRNSISSVNMDKKFEQSAQKDGSLNKEEAFDKKTDNREVKVENNKEKLNIAIKTDIEYQEKICSVKNYWSKLIENNPETKDNKLNKQELKSNVEDCNNNHDDKQCKKQDEINDKNETTVESIIKSLESVKIVDSIRKISQSKLNLWKDETEKVKSDTEIEESNVKKIVKDCEGNETYEKPKYKTEIDLSRDTPEIEIVELCNEDNLNEKTQATLIKARGFEKGCDEFDHVRYKVMKSELFKNSMIANYRKEAQFDGLLQYLQDYSFQELLVNNNIVIIEPVRTKIEPAPRKNQDTCKIPPTMLKRNEIALSKMDKSKSFVKRHFFYHPIRVNKEIIEEELPNPDTVKKVRNLFEDTLKMKSPMTHDPPLLEDGLCLTRRATSYRNLNEEVKGTKLAGRKKVIRPLTIDTNFGNKKWDNASLSSGVSSGDVSSNNEYENDGINSYSHKNLKDNDYSSSDEYLCDSVGHDFCCESQYVSPDIMKKIRDCGTSITYYGGKVMNSKGGSNVSPMTKAIMDEIKGLQKNCSRDCYSCHIKCRGEKCSCLSSDKHKPMQPEKKTSNSSDFDKDHANKLRTENFPAFKFKLVKSNSCSSRLELTGTDDSKNRMKFRKQHSTDDPPLECDDENSVKNKICRLESYNKGIAKSPFENKDSEKKMFLHTAETKKFAEGILQNKTDASNQQTMSASGLQQEVCKEQEANDNSAGENKDLDTHSFEKKFYYVNDKTDQNKTSTGKFGEMVFEEFEVLESRFDSLNSNISLM